MSGVSGQAAPPEFSRPVAVARIGAGLQLSIEMRATEAQAVAARMGLAAVHSLACDFELRRCEAGAVAARGRLRARVRQDCVVTLDVFDADLAEDFAIRFVPAGTEACDLDVEAEDEVPYEGDTIDLGEAACEQLALTLDPFPRKPGAVLQAVEGPEAVGAFAALSKLLPPR